MKQLTDSLESRELDRLTKLYELCILDSEPDPEFDDLLRLMSEFFQVPIAYLSLVETDRQWFKSRIGFNFTETSRELSICTYVVKQGELLVVEDLMEDVRFQQNPLIQACGLRSYAGVPLLTENGQSIGTLCLLDREPRSFSEEETRQLQAYASVFMKMMVWRKTSLDHQDLQKSLMQANELLSDVLTNVNEVLYHINEKGEFTYLSPSWETLTGYHVEESIGTSILDYLEEKNKLENAESFKEAVRTGQYHIQQMLRLRMKDGTLIWVNSSVSMIVDEKRNLVEVYGILSDETELVELGMEKERDIELAKTIQRSLLPRPIQQSNFKISGEYHPSLDLSGDFYYWLELSPTKLGVILMDVMGHGVASALVNMSIRSLLNGIMRRVEEPTRVFEELNQHMRSLRESTNLYMTAIYLVVDTETQTVDYINCGHPSGIVLTPSTCTVLEKGTVPIGLLHRPDVEKGTFRYDGNTEILLYTDGLHELVNERPFENWLYDRWKKYKADPKAVGSFATYLFQSFDKKTRLPDDVSLVSIVL